MDIRPGEGKRALLACACLLLVIASYTVVKSVRDALFLSKFGITQLSFMAIGLAVGIGFLISVYVRFTAGMPRHVLIGGTNTIIVASLVLIWLGLFSEGLRGVLPWVLYIWSSVFGVFLVMQFWLLAQDLFDPREAKRLFGVVGAGAILGGVSGGFLSRGLASVLGANNLLLLAGGMLALEVVLVAMVWPLRRKEEVAQKKPKPAKDGKKKTGGGLDTLRDNKVVRLLAIALLLATMATTLLDWQFKGIVKDEFKSRPDEMAAFFGSLYAYLSVASFVVQTLLTSTILRRFGVGLGLLMLPVSVLGGSALILAHGLLPMVSRLTAASAAKVAEGGLRFSVDKASMELMWLPVPPDIKERGKSFVDTVVDRFGTGLTGFIWLALAALGLDAPNRIHLISFAVVGLVVIWLLVILNARGAYLGALRDAISERKLDLDGSSLNLVDPQAVAPLRGMLRSEDPREALFALHMLEHFKGPLEELSSPLSQDDPRVRVEVLRFLSRRQDPRHRELAAASLAHADLAVREAAVIYLHSTAPVGVDPLVEQLSEDSGVDRHTLEVIKLGIPQYAMSAANSLEQALARDDGLDEQQRLDLIRIIGGAPPELAAALLAAPLSDDDPHVVRTAALAAGRAGAVGLAPELRRLLEDRRFRRVASVALHDMGAASADLLQQWLQDDQLSTAARRVTIRLLGSCGEPSAVPLLLGQLSDAEFSVSHGALRALTRLVKKTQTRLESAQEETVRQVIDRELSTLYRDLVFMERGSWADLRQQERPADLLGCALAERADDRVERIFRLQALLCGQDSEITSEDIEAAYRSVRSPLKSTRASSIEFLDNVLPTETAARLLPLLENTGAKRFASVASQSGVTQPQRPELLEQLLAEHDAVLQSVAAWTVGAEQMGALSGALEPLVEGEDAAVAKLARVALQQLDSTQTEDSKTMAMNAVEKALTLQKVDVLQRASTDDLMHIAQIASEVSFPQGAAIYHEGDAPDALFVIIGGKVRLHRGDEDIAELGEGEAFGSWALVDESPRVASASTVEASNVLQVNRDEFMELLADRVDIVQAIFKAMVERLRNLAELTKEG